MDDVDWTQQEKRNFSSMPNKPPLYAMCTVVAKSRPSWKEIDNSDIDTVGGVLHGSPSCVYIFSPILCWQRTSRIYFFFRLLLENESKKNKNKRTKKSDVGVHWRIEVPAEQGTPLHLCPHISQLRSFFKEWAGNNETIVWASKHKERDNERPYRTTTTTKTTSSSSVDIRQIQ